VGSFENQLICIQLQTKYQADINVDLKMKYIYFVRIFCKKKIGEQEQRIVFGRT
jgi:hypothetical protein